MITTVSITRCWRKSQCPRRFRALVEIALASCAVLCLLLGAPLAQAETATEIGLLRIQRSDEGLLLTASVQFDLPAVVEDALDKGIPMFFVAEAVLLRDRWYWYDKEVTSAERHMRLSYQPLTRRWRLVVSPQPIGNSGLALGQTFDTREEAMAAVKHISHWKIAEPRDVEPDARYSVEFRFRLDVSQLPRPFQIGAVGHADWNIAASRSQRLVNENPK